MYVLRSESVLLLNQTVPFSGSAAYRQIPFLSCYDKFLLTFKNISCILLPKTFLKRKTEGIIMKQKTLSSWLKAILVITGICGLVVYLWIIPEIADALLQRAPELEAAF